MLNELVREKQKMIVKQTGLGRRVAKDFAKNKVLYLMILPIVFFYAIFHYGPMYGALIAFQNYSPLKGMLHSPWVGLDNFRSFFGSYYFQRIFKNTVWLSVLTLVFEFPMPIILALFINEVQNHKFRRIVQSVTYMPYFISTIVVCGMIIDFTNGGGVVTTLLSHVGGDGKSLLQKPEWFRPIYVLSEIWQKIGWDSIIYLAALMAIDLEQYEAAKLDGASRWKQMWSITLPGILPTIIIMFILRVGNMFNIGFEKIILLYNPLTYGTADIISTFVYRKGLLEFNWSYSAAVGIFNSMINLFLLLAANRLSRKVSGNSLW